MVQQIELKKEDLAKKIDAEHKALVKKIMEANKNLVDRAREFGFTFDLDREEDILTITIGAGVRDTYSQGLDHIYVDLDLDTDEIVSFTILDFENAYLKTKEGRELFSERIILPVLRKYGTLSFPPEREGTRIAADELRTLVPV